jgi:2-(1,2-epoxy-1,2-dihydrophenyl)acetyl-CoA isomerase
MVNAMTHSDRAKEPRVPTSVEYDLTEGVATITLARPDAMNSLTAQTRTELREAVRRARDDAAVRAVVLTGSGRAFCVGQDLREHAANLDAGRGLAGALEEHYEPIVLGLARMLKPVVAAVNGAAAGAGLSFALACDLRIASERASFATAFTKIGLAPDSALSWTLQRLVGRAKALELLLLAEPVRAPEALELGLVNRVVPPEELAATARELAVSLAAGPTLAYGAVKAAVEHAAATDLAGALAKEAELQNALAGTADHVNATKAFLAKEPPVFEGR